MGRTNSPDSFADTINFIDRGCFISPTCLACPLPECIYDKDRRKEVLAERDSTIYRLHKKGKETSYIMGYFKLSYRSVLRILQHQREAHGQRAS